MLGMKWTREAVAVAIAAMLMVSGCGSKIGSVFSGDNPDPKDIAKATTIGEAAGQFAAEEISDLGSDEVMQARASVDAAASLLLTSSPSLPELETALRPVGKWGKRVSRGLSLLKVLLVSLDADITNAIEPGSVVHAGTYAFLQALKSGLVMETAAAPECSASGWAG
jgi:hypothetical protein